MKKAQILAEPFIIIFALIVAILVLAFGFKAVLDIQEKAKLAELLDAQAEIHETARTMYTLGENSQKTLKLRVPKNIKCLCFTDKDETNLPLVNNYCNENNPSKLQNVMSLNSGNYQLYITPSHLYSLNKFKVIPQLKTNTNSLLCILVRDSLFQAKLTSKGRYVEVSQ